MDCAGNLGMRNARSGTQSPTSRSSRRGGADRMKTPPAIAAKIKRLISDPSARLRGLDLFAGCGGLSLGFQAAGVSIVAAMEIDDLAARSHAINFCKGEPAYVIDQH